MDKYLLKYKKYKTKYFNLLKKQKGGNYIIFNFDRYKDLFRRFIFELNYEMAFSIDYDSNNNLISQFIKGIPFVDDEEQIDMEKKIFNKKVCFTHINCHTHDNFSARKLFPELCPPSGADFITILENYYKYNTYLNLIFAPEGIYEISLGETLLDELNQEQYDLVKNVFLPMSRQYHSHMYNDAWEELKDRIYRRTNSAQILVAKPYNLEPGFYEEIQELFRERYPELPDIENLGDYLEFIRYIGFNINFYTWDEPLNISLTIPKYMHDFLNATIKAKQQGFLLDLLLFNASYYRDDETLAIELNENNYVNISDKSNDELFNIATS